MKTPQQLADARLERQDHGQTTLFLGDKSIYNISAEHAEEFREAMVVAILADRAQRDESVAAAVAKALRDRGSEAAATWVEDPDNADEVWQNYLGPVVDEIEIEHSGNTCSCSDPASAEITGHGRGCDLHVER